MEDTATGLRVYVHMPYLILHLKIKRQKNISFPTEAATLSFVLYCRFWTTNHISLQVCHMSLSSIVSNKTITIIFHKCDHYQTTIIMVIQLSIIFLLLELYSPSLQCILLPAEIIKNGQNNIALNFFSLVISSVWYISIIYSSLTIQS